VALKEQIVQQNETYLDLIDRDGAFRKKAEEEASDFIRRQLREESFSEQILPSEDVGNDFDRALWTDKPIKIYDKEMTLSQSIAVGYMANPTNFYIRPSRFAVTPTMLMSPKVIKNKWELRTYKHDVRKLFADNMVKDLQAVKDMALLSAVNAYLIGPGSTVPYSGVAQYKQISGGFSRNSTVTACHQIVQQTPFNIPVETNLVNNITWSEQYRWDLIEAGVDRTAQTLVDPYTKFSLHGQNWLVTIKRGLVANMVHYLFGPTAFLGKACRFTPPTMLVKTENFGVYMFQCAEEYGVTLAHSGALGRADYLA